MKNSYKVYASMISFDSERAEFTEKGPKLVIPLTYPGWFQLITHKDTELHSLKTIADVANAQISEFMIDKTITAYRCRRRSRDGADDDMEAVDVIAGEVLTTSSVLTEWLSDESIESGCFCLSRTKPKPDSSLMKVRDSNGVQLLIPYNTEATLYEVGRRMDTSRSATVYRLTDIVRWLQLPVDLKLVRGQLPEALDGCTGLFRLQQLSVGGTTLLVGAAEELDERLVEFAGDDSELDILPRCRTWSTLPRCQGTKSSKAGSKGDCLAYSKTLDDRVFVWPESEDQRVDLQRTNALQTGSVLTRSLPPTPLLPQNVKQKRAGKGWSWAKNLLNKHRKSSSDLQELDLSETSDYEVIPFYLRTTANSLTEEDCCTQNDPEVPSSGQMDSQLKDVENDFGSDWMGSVPSPPPPPVPPQARTAGKVNKGSLDNCHRDAVGTGDDIGRSSANSHDEEGYLLPVEIRLMKTEARSIKSAVKDCCNGSFCGSRFGQEEDVTVPTRTMTTTSSSRSSSSSSPSTLSSSASTNGSLNKSTVTLMAPASSGTMPSYVKSTGESEYSPARFDKQRLDAFLADSIDELRRRQSRPSPATGSDRDTSGPRCGHVIQIRHGIKDDVDAFLDKIFDCDTVCEDRVDSSQSSANTTTAVAPTGGGFQDRRSMSFPESVLVRPDQHAVYPGSRHCVECGYQTIDSGIWLSPRSAVSDPYRQERDSATYRSTSDCSWVPPENIDQLTVEEVGLSLRYIGMKDFIITRFCEEQIDGKQLVELTDQLISEGFPELNALEKKKLRDFIKGWRPKKWGFTPAE